VKIDNYQKYNKLDLFWINFWGTPGNKDNVYTVIEDETGMSKVSVYSLRIKEITKP